jgi:hypothetical protein
MLETAPSSKIFYKYKIQWCIIQLTNILDITHCIILLKKHFWELALLPSSGKSMKPTRIDPVNESQRIENTHRTNLVVDGKDDLLYKLLHFGTLKCISECGIVCVRLQLQI